MTPQKLYRNRTDRMICGICGGMAQYFGIDSTIVRLFFVLGAIFSGGLFGLAYLVVLLVVPSEPADAASAAAFGEGFGAGSADPSSEPPGFSAFGQPDSQSFGFTSNDMRERRNQWVGWGLLGLGLFFLVCNLHLLNWLNFHVTWPAFLILGGVYLLLRQRRQI
jgi:phage shock protein C